MSIRKPRALFILLVLNACTGADKDNSSDCAQGPWSDIDEDNHLPEGSFDNCEEIPEELARFADDCDDHNPARYGTAIEICDGLDNDCDDATDEDVIDASTWYADTDGDGYGNSAVSVEQCDQPDGYVSDASDPDDSSASIYPDGSSTDSDHDSDGYSDSAGDCDDESSAMNPAAEEICDGQDNDCDGETDNDASDASTWYADADGDGYGDPGSTLNACEAPEGYVADMSDTDDASAIEYAGSEAVDDDGDGETDEEGDCKDDDAYITSETDEDGDGSPYCDDCDDTDATVYPGAARRSGGVDADCDGEIDEVTGPSEADDEAGLPGAWVPDCDNDGYGADGWEEPDLVGVAFPDCTYLDVGGDCDDGETADAAQVHPDASEICDDLDNDCDGLTDDEDPSLDGSTSTYFYADDDGDGVPDTGSYVVACEAPEGYIARTGESDCDDAQVDVYPGATEICDRQANDCDHEKDWLSSNEDGEVWWQDAETSAWTEVTGDFSGTYTISSDGTLNICAGTFAVNVVVDDGTDVEIKGIAGRDNTILDGTCSGSVLYLGDYVESAISGLTLTGGYSSLYGGGLYVGAASSVTVDLSTITDNIGNFGGGVWVYNSDLIMTQTKITDNRAGNDGGGIYVATSGSLSLEDSEVSGNIAYAGYGGGGIFFKGDELTLTNTTVSENNSKAEGGGLYVTDAAVALTDVTLRDNTAIGSGGGLFCEDCIDVDVEGSTIQGNTSYGNGGGISGTNTVGNWDMTSISLSSTTLSGNSAVDGGGLHAYYVENVTLESTSFVENEASESGGGLYVDSDVGIYGDWVTTTCADADASTYEFDANTAARYGDDVYISLWSNDTFASSGCDWSSASGRELYLDRPGSTSSLWSGLSNPFTCDYADGCY